MIRVFLAVLAMFFLPFLLYAAYVFIRRKGEVNGNLLQDAPINWLAVAGTILALATLGRLVSMDILEYEAQQSAPAQTQGTQSPGRSP